MTERRYSDAEAAEIFGRAAEMERTAPRALDAADGMSLAQLQEIGREAGLHPDLVAAAARVVERQPAARPTRYLGLPIGVARTVELDRRVDEAEWNDLVGQLRHTFDAGGSLRYDGPFRQWSNGNLRVMVEPTTAGHRVRFRTVNGGARAMIGGGIMSAGFSAVIGLMSVVLGRPELLNGAGVIGMMGAGMFLAGALPLPGWARRRADQMDQLAEQLTREPSRDNE